MALIAKNLGFYYRREQWIFKEINFEVSPGEILGIFGYSGCGKTSLSKVLSDFLSPVEGEVLIDGKNIKNINFEKCN
ncbi:hypothetical protein C095_04350 [Fusobacterium necrophorum subsp. funduliforme B35]|uniref:ABC transporter domain-containing protein n=1 Tax=Fusobacterium necrophorum subsp. funduliforme B35 TaxID=1226633 RepID=A0A0B4EWT5_9FUSO|nr:hypothetical protein C095_04350 [Fusobacterium necrophorum subsp. funduliforme B35]